MRVVGRVWIRKATICVIYYIKGKEGWLETNSSILIATNNRRHKRFDISRRFKYSATKLLTEYSHLPNTDSSWQKEWEVDERLVRKMFGLW